MDAGDSNPVPDAGVEDDGIETSTRIPDIRLLFFTSAVGAGLSRAVVTRFETPS